MLVDHNPCIAVTGKEQGDTVEIARELGIEVKKVGGILTRLNVAGLHIEP
ncbi:MAG: hypothetical protein V3R93_05285 [Candidatus Hydrothermarchaeaceae archaeon]